MNFPFRFAAASANAILQLNDESANLILKALKDSTTYTDANKARFALLGQPIVPSWLYNLSLSGDKDCVVEFGLYNQVATEFTPQYAVSLLVAGSNIFSHQFNTGYAAPFGGALVPALKVVTGTSVILTGHAEYIPNGAERTDAPITLAPSGSPLAVPAELTLLL